MRFFQEEVEQENQKQRQLFADLIAAIEKQLSRLKLQLKLYGSFGTGLMMNHSDINLIALPSGDVDLTEIMHDIELELRDMNDHIDSVEYIRQFRLIKITASAEYGGKRLSLNIL